MTDATHTEPTAVARPSFGAGFTGALQIFIAPKAVFERVQAGVSFWPVLVVMVLVAMLAAYLMLPYQLEAARLQMAETGTGLTEDGELGSTMRTTIVVTSFLGAAVAVPLVMLLSVFFYWLAFTVTFGGVPFGRLYTLGLYTGLVVMLMQVLNGIYLRFTNPEIASAQDIAAAGLDFSLKAFTGGEGFLAGMLGQVGLFQIWEQALFIAGASLLLNRRWTAVIWPVLAIFILWAAIAGVFAGFGARFS